uniref:G_PROTEIN_RECEP_F1_2 domain-containing protein n=1 Tax=Panagrellus redivivus TaxID=6233 RepID=A0A7E4WDE5_PANRE
MTFSGIQPSSQTASNITATIYVYAFQTLLLSVVVQFIYRYLILVRKFKVSNCFYTGILIPSLTVSTLLCAGFYYVIDIMPPCSENVISQLKGDNSHDHGPCVEFNINHVAAKILLLVAMITATIVAAIIVILNVLVYKFISQKAALSSNESSIQLQVSRTLIIQLCVVASCGFLPCICILMNIVLASDNAWLSLISECVFSLSPAVNSVFTIFTIKSYRRNVIRVIQKFVMLNDRHCDK